MGFVADTFVHPTRNTLGVGAVASSAPWGPHDPITKGIAVAATTFIRRALGRRAPRSRSIDYFLFIGGSSTKLAQNPLGLTLEAFFTILIFIVIS
jgi:hypothetical protein